MIAKEKEDRVKAKTSVNGDDGNETGGATGTGVERCLQQQRLVATSRAPTLHNRRYRE